MQDYLEDINCKRPLYADLAHKEVDERFHAFSDAADIVARMKDSRKKNSTILTMGLWPLDFVSINDWRQSTHGPRVFAEYVAMARIEICLVEEYRASMFQDCKPAAYIRSGLASALAAACKSMPWEVENPLTGKLEKRSIRRFKYVDKIPCDVPSLSTAPEVDVVDLKQTRERLARTDALAADAVGLLKKLENFKGSAAAPNSKLLDLDVSIAITSLKRVRRLLSIFTTF
jgi:hypothetical protein